MCSLWDQLIGLRYSREEAGGIIQDLDPMGWGSYVRPLKSKKRRGRRLVAPQVRRCI